MSKLFSLNTNDWLKGLIVAVLGATLTLVIQILQAGATIDFKAIVTTAIVAGLSYIVKQLGTDHDGRVLGKIDLHSKP